MKKIKKLTSVVVLIALLLAAVLTAAGCSHSENEKTPETEAPSAAFDYSVQFDGPDSGEWQ